MRGLVSLALAVERILKYRGSRLRSLWEVRLLLFRGSVSARRRRRAVSQRVELQVIRAVLLAAEQRQQENRLQARLPESRTSELLIQTITQRQERLGSNQAIRVFLLKSRFRLNLFAKS